MTEAEIFCAVGPSNTEGLGEETYFTFGDGSRAFQDANGRRSLLSSMKHYVTAALVTKETQEHFGDEALIQAMIGGHPLHWSFVRKEEDVDGISGHPKVAYVFERWEEE